MTKTSTTKHRLLTLASFLALIIFVQGLGSVATFSSVDTWYPTLKKVSWNPPPWVFGPVWTTLYLMIALSGWRVWMRLHRPSFHHPAIRWYFFQLAANLLWSLLFFGLRNPLAAGIDIVILLAAIIMTIRYFRHIDKLATWLLVTYLLWVSYAVTLNIGIVILN